ncbi:hypothetical protein Srufu_030200 [Streptomyces libani subsp. rufus]|nr:hypothetical protein Srufu_030200 [Streptomyces libani subsp. rufus]
MAAAAAGTAPSAAERGRHGMERHTIEPRPGWQQTVEAQGLIYPLTRYPDDSLRPYWDESAYYSFTLPRSRPWKRSSRSCTACAWPRPRTSSTRTASPTSASRTRDWPS